MDHVDQWLQKAVEDFWRSYFYTPKDTRFIRYLFWTTKLSNQGEHEKHSRQKHLLNQGHLFAFVKQYLIKKHSLIPSRTELEKRLEDPPENEDLTHVKQRFSDAWNKHRQQIETLLESLMNIVDGRKVKIKNPENRQQLIEEVDVFCNEEGDGFTCPSLVTCLRQGVHTSHSKKGRTIPPHPIYESFEAFFCGMQRAKEICHVKALLLRHDLIEYTEETLKTLQTKMALGRLRWLDQNASRQGNLPSPRIQKTLHLCYHPSVSSRPDR